MCCSRCSRGFRAVLKRQEAKGRTEFAVCSLCTLENPDKMTSEKADVIYPSPKKTKFEQLRADHELFLQAFESRFVGLQGPSARFIQFNQSPLDLYFSIFRFQNPHKFIAFFEQETLSR